MNIKFQFSMLQFKFRTLIISLWDSFKQVKYEEAVAVQELTR